MNVGRIFDIQPFSLHDGPGIRTTVFMQGCSLRCDWCHNPESQPLQGAMLFYSSKCISCGACADACPQGNGKSRALHTDQCTLCGLCAENCYADAVTKSGRKISVNALVDEVLKDLSIYRTSGGGVTFSGGEPLLQADFLAMVMAELKKEKVHIAVESCMYVPFENVEKVLPFVDLFYMDVKCLSPALHKARTGGDNQLILSNIEKLSALGKNIILRTPVVPGFNMNMEEMTAIGAFVKNLPSAPPLELLAFHGMCASKYAALGKTFKCANTKEPVREDMEQWVSLFKNMGVQAKYST